MAAQNRLGTAAIDVIGNNAKFRKVINQNVKDVKKLSKTVKQQQKQFDKSNKAQEAFRGGMAKIAGLAAGGLALGTITQHLNEMTKAAAEGAKHLNVMFNAANRAGDIGITNSELEAMVQNISALSGESVNVGRTAATKLLNVAENSKIAGDNIERTLKLAQDMASSGWGDLEGNIEEIAEVFALPAEAVTTLEKYNVFFNDAARKHLEYLVDTGRELEAMEMIYDRMEAKFSGATEAANQGLQGAINRRNTEFELLQETLGNVISEGLNLEGVFNSLADTMGDFRIWLDRTFLGGQLELQGLSTDQLAAELARLQAERAGLPTPDVDPGSLDGYDVGSTDEFEEERRELNQRINAINEALDARELEATIKSVTAGIAKYDDFIANQNADAANRKRNAEEGKWSDRLGADVVGGLERIEKAQKIADKAEAERQKSAERRRQTIDETIKGAEKELEFLEFFGQLQGKQLEQARAMWDLGQQVDEQMSDEDLERYNEVIGKLYDAERAKETAEVLRQYSADIASGFSSMGSAMIEFQRNGEFSLKKLRDEGLDVAADIAQKFADRAIWEPFETMLTNLFDGVVQGISTGQGLGDAFSSAFTALSGSKSTGGRVQAGRGYKVHDGEMFVPDRAGYVYSKADVRSMSGAGGNQVVFSPTINSNDPDAVEARLREMMPEFAQFAKEQITYDRSRPGKVASAFGGNA